MTEPLTDAQQQTLRGRRALAESFSSPEEKSAYYQELGRRSAERRVVLTGDERAALVSAYDQLSAIVERIRVEAASDVPEANEDAGGSGGGLAAATPPAGSAARHP
jgi:hypothetical protein